MERMGLTRGRKTFKVVLGSHTLTAVLGSSSLYRAQCLTYSGIAKLGSESGSKVEDLIHSLRTANGSQIRADDPGFIPLVKDISRLPPEPLVVVFKPIVSTISER